MATVHCPKCGGEDIREYNTAVAFLPVTSWEIDEDGLPSPDSYEVWPDGDWETGDTSTPYSCATCHWEGALDDLKVKGDPIEPMTAAEADEIWPISSTPSPQGGPK